MENVNENDSLENWDSFTGGKYIKAENVNSNEDAFIVVAVTQNSETERLELTIESNQKSYVLDLNKTNATFIKNSGVASPREIVGKKIYFKKVLVRNPSTNQEVEGLRISKVE